MQFFSMLFYFDKENSVNKTSPQLSFKLFVKLF